MRQCRLVLFGCRAGVAQIHEHLLRQINREIVGHALIFVQERAKRLLCPDLARQFKVVTYLAGATRLRDVLRRVERKLFVGGRRHDPSCRIKIKIAQ